MQSALVENELMGSNTKILIVGAKSIIGAALASHCDKIGYNFLFTSHENVSNNEIYLNLQSSDSVNSFEIPKSITKVVFCAAVTNLNYCEENVKKSYLVNVENTIVCLRRFLDFGARVIFLSTDKVFNGEKPNISINESRSPIYEYAKQKAEVEEFLENYKDQSCIIRLGKVLFNNMPLLKSWIDDLKCGKTIHPFSDWVVAPVHIDEVCDAILNLSSNNHIIHLSANKDITYAEMAFFIAEELGLDAGKIVPRLSTDMGVNLKHTPKYASLGAQLSSIDWKEAVKKAIS